MIGLDISDRSIKIVELSDVDLAVIRTVCWSSLPPNLIQRGIVSDKNKVATILTETLNKCSPVPVADKIVTLSLPETKSFVRVLNLPTMSKKEMDEAVQWAIRQHIPFDLDRVYIDWQTLDITGDRQQVLVAAAQRDVVDPLLQVIDSTGLQVVALELEAQAIARSLLPRDAANIQGILIVDLGATYTNVIFYDRGVIRFTASVDKGGDDLTQYLIEQLNLKPSIAAEKKALVGVQSSEDSQISAALRLATTDLIQRVAQVAREGIPHPSTIADIKSIQVTGGTANLPGIISIFADIFPDTPIQIGTPWVIAASEGRGAVLSTIDAVHFTTAIGLALRKVSYA